MPGRSWLDAVVRRRVRERMKGRFEGSCMLTDLISVLSLEVEIGSYYGCGRCRFDVDNY